MMNVMNPVGSFGPTFAGLAQPAADPMQMQVQMQMRALELQMAVLMSLMLVGGTANGNGGGAMTGLASGLSPNFGGASGGNGVNSFLGGVSPTTSVASGSPPAGGGSGQAAVDNARKFLNQDSISLKGRLPHFTAAGGTNNNCADFVSSVLEGQGLVKGHHINVKSFEQELLKQGYRQVPASQARPGDVWISNSRGHTELVATAGATRLIGSNNNGDSRQEITEHNNRPGSGVIYQKA